MHTELSACWVLLNLTSTSVATAFLSQYIEDLDACEVVSCGAHVCATHIRARAHTQTHVCQSPPLLATRYTNAFTKCVHAYRFQLLPRVPLVAARSCMPFTASCGMIGCFEDATQF